MMLFVILAALAVIAYCVFIVYVIINTKFSVSAGGVSQSRLTVIIPCRNEVDTIGYCLDSLVRQSLPALQFDVIVVDDFSEDFTVNIAEQFSRKLSLRILKNTLPGKKNALTLGVAHSATDLIITTDADCTMGPEWLATMMSEFEKAGLNFLCGPVNFNDSDTLFGQLQQAESAAIIGISAAMLNTHKPATCNGANLMFRKSLFDQLGGYQSHRHLATGDDDLLMQAFYKVEPSKVRYTLNKEAMVFTKACADINEFMHQRIRWLAKRKHYLYSWNARMQVLIFAQLIGFYFLFFYALYSGNKLASCMVLLKYGVDLRYGLKLKRNFRFQLHQIFLMPFYESYIFLVLFFSYIKEKQWKGRTI